MAMHPLPSAAQNRLARERAPQIPKRANLRRQRDEMSHSRYTQCSMAAVAHRGLRTVFALLLLCAILIGQSAALTSIHELHRAQGHACQVCYLGSLPFLKSAGEASLAPVWLVSRLESLPNFDIPTATVRRPVPRAPLQLSSFATTLRSGPRQKRGPFFNLSIQGTDEERLEFHAYYEFKEAAAPYIAPPRCWRRRSFNAHAALRRGRKSLPRNTLSRARPGSSP